MARRPGPQVEPARWHLPADPSRPPREPNYLALIAVATVLLWQTQWGSVLLFPFTLLATWFHEMGHGLAAIMLGGEFDRLVIFADGSGYARTSLPPDLGAIGRACIPAAGLIGPSLAGSVLILASRSPKASAIALLVLGAMLALTTLIWVRSLAGWLVLPGFAVACIGIAAFAREGLQRFAVELLGVQGAISLWQDLGYLFSDHAYVDGRMTPSDTGAIADALILPYWFWGGLISLLCAAMIWMALRHASSR